MQGDAGKFGKTDGEEIDLSPEQKVGLVRDLMAQSASILDMFGKYKISSTQGSILMASLTALVIGGTVMPGHEKAYSEVFALALTEKLINVAILSKVVVAKA